MEEKYTAEVSAQKIIERIKHLLAQGVPRPLKRKWVERGFDGYPELEDRSNNKV